MMAWELALIPMVLVPGILRKFAIVFGLSFFLVSMFVLQLGKLSHYQFVLWGILFWPGWWTNRENKERIYLFYDDRCNLCDRTVWFLSHIDVFNIIELAPISKNEAFADENGLSNEAVLNDLYGVHATSKEKFGGFQLYLELTRRLLLLVPFFPVLYLGKITSIGPRIYRWVADRRRAIFGVCEMPSVNPTEVSREAPECGLAWGKNTFFNAFLATYLLLLGVYVIRLPYLYENIPAVAEVREQLKLSSSKWLRMAPSLHGQVPLSVFTPDVLMMGTHYFTFSRVLANGEQELVPYVGPRGERLEWVLESDRLYFGHSLKWRRTMYGRGGDRICYEPDRDDRFFKQLFMLADRMYPTAAQRYKIDFYHQGLANLELLNGVRYELPPIEHICTVEFSPSDGALIPGSMVHTQFTDTAK